MNICARKVILRGVYTDHIHMDALQQASFIDSFYEVFESHQSDMAPIDMDDIFAKPSIWDAWNTNDFDRYLTFYFLDRVDQNHTIVQRLLDDWAVSFDVLTTDQALIQGVHRSFQAMAKDSSLHARTLMNLEVSMIQRLASMAGIDLPDVYAFDGLDVFNQCQYGICWQGASGWQSIPFGDANLGALHFDEFFELDLNGRVPQRVLPNGQRSIHALQIVDPNHRFVADIVDKLFPTFDGLGVRDVIRSIRNYMQHVDYIADDSHEWQSLDTIFLRGGEIGKIWLIWKRAY